MANQMFEGIISIFFGGLEIALGLATEISEWIVRKLPFKKDWFSILTKSIAFIVLVLLFTLILGIAILGIFYILFKLF